MEQMRMSVVGVDVGGTSGRTVFSDSSTGVIKVKIVKAGEAVLYVLRK